MSGFYLNELLLKLTERCDPHPEIFCRLRLLRAGAVRAAGSRSERLRRFEKRLLNDLGYGLELSQTRDGVPVQSGRAIIDFALERGPQFAWRRRPAPFMANRWPICRQRASRMPARCATPSACCAPPSMPVSTAAPEIPRGHAGASAARPADSSDRLPGAFVNEPKLHGSIALGVNIDHVATLRQARRARYPDPCSCRVCSRRSRVRTASRCICARTGATFRTAM